MMGRIGIVAVSVGAVVCVAFLIVHFHRPLQPETTVPSDPSTAPAASLPNPEIVRVKLPAGSIPVAPPAEPSVEFKFFENKRDIYIKKGREWVNLTRFNRPQNVFDYAASSDGHFIYVWHHEYPPRKLSIYETKGLTRISRWEPGFGGSLRWTPANTILHWWGCGTNCQNYRVYDIDGKELLEGNATGLDVSPSGRFLIICPSLPLAVRGLELIDLANLTTIYKSNIKPAEAWVSEVRWISETKIDVEYVQMDSRKFHRRMYIESTKSLRLSTPFQTGL